MSPDLQDRKIKLLKELEAIEARLMEKELSDTIEQAWQHVVEARDLIQADSRTERKEKMSRRAWPTTKLESELLEAENKYVARHMPCRI